MNIHINIDEIYNNDNYRGIIIKFTGTTYQEEKYHTYLPNKEIAQLIQELSEILTINLYNIDEKNEEE